MVLEIISLKNDFYNRNLSHTFIFFIVITILAARLTSWMFFSGSSNEYSLYYFFIGLIILIIGSIIFLFTPIKLDNIFSKVIILTIGIGLTIDQFLFLIIKEKDPIHYLEFPSIVGMVFLVILIFLYMKFLEWRQKEEVKIKETTNFIIKKKFEIYLFVGFLIGGLFLPRFIVFLFPGLSAIIFDFEVHHLYWGVLLIIIFLLPLIFSCHFHPDHSRFFVLNFIFVGFGIGLVIDEFVFLFTGGTSDSDYWQDISLIFSIFFLIIIIVWILILYRRLKKYKKFVE